MYSHNVLITQQQDFHTNHANSARHKRTHLQNSESKQCTSWVHCNSNTMTFVLEPFYKLSFPTSSFHSGLTTTCTVLVGIQKCCCSMATPAINLMWSDDDAQFQKPHCCFATYKTTISQAYGNMKLDLLKSCIQNTKRKSKSWSQFLPSFQQKCVSPLLGTTSFLPQVTLFSFLDLVCCEVFFFFQSFVWMKFTA